MKEWIYILCETKRSSDNVKKILAQVFPSYHPSDDFTTCFGVKRNIGVTESMYRGSYEGCDRAVEKYILGSDLTLAAAQDWMSVPTVTMEQVYEKFGHKVRISTKKP